MSNPFDPSKLLAHHPLFSGFTDTQLSEISRHVHVNRLQPDQVLFRHGDPAESFYIVAHGQVKLYRVSPDGVEKVMNVMTSGRSFAEAVMFMPQPVYPVSVQSIGETTVVSVNMKAYKTLLQQDVKNCFALITSLCTRLQGYTNEVESLILTNATHRIVRYLARLLPIGSEQTADIVLELPKQVLASRLSVKPETFSRVLNALTQSGIIKVENKIIHVLDVPALLEYES